MADTTTAWVQPPATQPTIVSDAMAASERSRILTDAHNHRAKMERLRRHQNVNVQKVVAVLIRNNAQPSDYADVYDALAGLNMP
jgi:hypothetical protein